MNSIKPVRNNGLHLEQLGFWEGGPQCLPDQTGADGAAPSIVRT
jgi:hypothetical protein